MSYEYSHARANPSHAYLWPALEREILRKSWSRKRAFDVGCGNGATCNMFSKQGGDVVGVDTSPSGIKHANSSFPHVGCEVGSAMTILHLAMGHSI
jgi:2-polyprenyl-3-methyl-5-hydroxy-6-metoxy-1,4-benzoquinol methylase